MHFSTGVLKHFSDVIDVRARGWRARAKPSFFGQKLHFSGRSQQPKMKKIFIKRKNGIYSV